MRPLTPRVLLATALAVLAGCSAPRPLPPYQKPIARTRIQTVRTTAYTHTEDDHVQYSNRNALGGTLKYGQINSAAADWSRWPAGTIFRIKETGEVFQVDDYGWALSGTNTIDLYKPSRSAMNAWGVRRVTIENLEWGDPHRSLAILKQRTKYRHIRRMVDEMEERMAELERPVDGGTVVATSAPEPVAPMVPVPPGAQPPPPPPTPVSVTRAEPVAVGRPTAVSRPGTTASNPHPAVANNPYFGKE